MNPQGLFIRTSGLFFVLHAAMASPAWAAGDHGANGASTADMADMADGEVRKVDKEAGKLTLRHGEIKSLDMPPMTMVFVVKDKAMLDKLKAGDKIRFKAVNDAGKFTVTEMQMAQ
jgi:Cu(I)/Ag(I) efflux system periplasmic protein CusF